MAPCFPSASSLPPYLSSYPGCTFPGLFHTLAGSSFLHGGTSHLGRDPARHAVPVPRWPARRVRLPAVFQLHVSRALTAPPPLPGTLLRTACLLRASTAPLQASHKSVSPIVFGCRAPCPWAAGDTSACSPHWAPGCLVLGGRGPLGTPLSSALCPWHGGFGEGSSTAAMPVAGSTAALCTRGALWKVFPSLCHCP